MLGRSEVAEGASRFAKVVALGASLVPAMLPSFAQAQQVASSGPTQADCDRLAVTEPGKAIGCRVLALQAETERLRAVGAQAKAESARLKQDTRAIEQEGRCADDLTAIFETNPAALLRARVILDIKPTDRPEEKQRKLATYGTCKLKQQVASTPKNG